MIVTEIEVPLFLPPSRVPRSVGVHVSSVIRCIATEQGILKPEWAEELSLSDVRVITDPVALIRISIGLAWEEWYIPQILGPTLGVADHPGEMEVDGLYATHDGESLSVIITDKMYLTGHEVKATYKSTKTVGLLKDQWMWLAQMKAYCRCMRTRFFILHVLFLCGNYKMPITPQLKHWHLEFTQQEVDDNWDLLTQYRDEKMRLI